jgi:hypothetical protein
MSYATSNTQNSKDLLTSLNRGIAAGATRKSALETTNSVLISTVMCSTYSPAVYTTSGSNVVNIPILQPANTVIEDIIPICTLDTGHNTATIGFKVGTAEGGTQIVAAVTNAIAGSGTSVTAGQGTSIHSKITTSLQGGAALTITPGAGYSDSERTIYAQVSGSTGGFTDSNGAFKVIAKYYNL